MINILTVLSLIVFIQSQLSRDSINKSLDTLKDSSLLETNNNIELNDSTLDQKSKGTVQIKMLVDTTGNVLQVVILKSSGFTELDSMAVNMATKWKFTPYVNPRNGKHYKVWVAAPIKFTLDK